MKPILDSIDTVSQLEELRGPHNRWRRLNNLYMIRDESARVIPFVLRREQAQFILTAQRRNFILKARKLGMSTLLALDALDSCLWYGGMHCAIVDRKEDEARAKLAMARLAWRTLGQHPDPHIAALGAKMKANLKLVNDSAGELVWSNGSRLEAGVSLRGGTPQRLHVSELGYIASHDRKRAEEIRAGSINAVPTGGEVTIETTHEGGKAGVSYDFARLAMDDTAATNALTAKGGSGCSGTLQESQKCGGKGLPLEWRFFFFPWYEHPTYRIRNGKPREEKTLEYFQRLEADHGINISPDRQAWYEAKRREQREAIFREFPSTPDEAFRAVVSGAIYPQMLTLRANGKIISFEHDRHAPLIAAWDLGVSDYTSIWLIQIAGREILWLDWHEDHGKGIGHYAEIIRAWERRYQKVIGTHLLPHDADTRERGSGKSCVQHLAEAGLARHTIKVVPRTPDRWQGINHLRNLLARSVFHTRCDQPRRDPTGQEHRSGIGCLESYHTQPVTSTGILREEPAHDESSHTADAARTFAEAHDRGLIDHLTTSTLRPHPRKPPLVKTGFRGH